MEGLKEIDFLWYHAGLLLVFPAVILLYARSRFTGLLVAFAVKPTLDCFWDVKFFEVFGFSLNSGKILAAIIIGLFAHYIFSFGLKKAGTAKFAKLLGLFLVLNLISLAWGFLINDDPHRISIASPLTLPAIADSLFRLSFFLAAYFAARFLIRTPRDIRRLCVAFALSGVLPIAIALVQLTAAAVGVEVMNFSSSQGVSRIAGLYHDSNSLAFVSFVSLVFSVSLVSMDFGGVVKVAFKALAAASLVIIFFTYSRTALVASAIFLVLWYSMYNRPLVILGAFTIVLITFLLSSDIVQRFSREIRFLSNLDMIFSDPVELMLVHGTDMGSGRVWLWVDALKHFFRFDGWSQWIGLGMNFDPHNSFIAVLLRNGVLGLSVFAALVFQFMKSVFIRHADFENVTDAKIVAFDRLAVCLFCSVAFIGLLSNLLDKVTLVLPTAVLLSIYLNALPFSREEPDFAGANG